MSRAHVLSLFNLMFLLYKTVGLNYFQDARCASFYEMAYAGSNSRRFLQNLNIPDIRHIFLPDRMISYATQC
jgi:hypothetical protein